MSDIRDLIGPRIDKELVEGLVNSDSTHLEIGRLRVWYSKEVENDIQDFGQTLTPGTPLDMDAIKSFNDMNDLIASGKTRDLCESKNGVF